VCAPASTCAGRGHRAAGGGSPGERAGAPPAPRPRVHFLLCRSPSAPAPAPDPHPRGGGARPPTGRGQAAHQAARGVFSLSLGHKRGARLPAANCSSRWELEDGAAVAATPATGPKKTAATAEPSPPGACSRPHFPPLHSCRGSSRPALRPRTRRQRQRQRRGSSSRYPPGARSGRSSLWLGLSAVQRPPPLSNPPVAPGPLPDAVAVDVTSGDGPLVGGASRLARIWGSSLTGTHVAGRSWSSPLAVSTSVPHLPVGTH
jgi:hypothetical protein